MAEILDKYVGTRLVHYMTIDIEGFEYGILEELLRGKILAEQGIAFCQVRIQICLFKSYKFFRLMPNCTAGIRTKQPTSFTNLIRMFRIIYP